MTSCVTCDTLFIELEREANSPTQCSSWVIRVILVDEREGERVGFSSLRKENAMSAKANATKLVKQIAESKAKIAKERDKLRAIFQDLESVLESLDTGIEGIEQGCIEIRGALDDISSYL